MKKKQSRKVIQPAWDIFCKGDFAGAEQVLQKGDPRLIDPTISPVPDIMIMKAFYLCRLHQFAEARKVFSQILTNCPDDRYAQQGYLLALEDELREKKQTKTGTLIVGIGTGRSGSTTLTQLLNKQQNALFSHEHPSRLSWKKNQSRFNFHQKRFDLLLNKFNFAGDVSHWWLPYLDDILQMYKNVRVVALKRDCQSTVESFLRIKGGVGKGAINHWIEHDGKFWTKNIWDECYPSFKTKSMEKAIEQYWTEYYDQVEKLIGKYPNSIRLFSTESLSEHNTQKDMLSFCGFNKPRVIENLHLNKDSIQDGNQIY